MAVMADEILTVVSDDVLTVANSDDVERMANMDTHRSILHVDMNSFYASVEQAENPSLRGKAVVVAGDPEQRTGIILAKSKETKPFGIKTAEPLWMALQRCPDLIVLPPQFALYQKYSKAAREIYYSYTDLVEPFGLDECWIDVTGSLFLHKKSALEIAQEISARAKSELGCTVSIGVSWNKIMAKFGSDYKKPDAITQITPENYQDIYWNAPVNELLYVGRATTKKLNASGYFTIGDLAKASDYYLKTKFGKVGFSLRAFAQGHDDSPVKVYDPLISDTHRGIKSYGNGLTAPRDLVCEADAKPLVYLLAESVAQRLREGDARARTVAVDLRDAETLVHYSRQKRLSPATASTQDIARAAWDLVASFRPLNEKNALRSITVRVTNLLDNSTQLASDKLFPADNEVREGLDHAIDALRDRFGNTVVQRGIELANPDFEGADIKKSNTVHPVGFFHN